MHGSMKMRNKEIDSYAVGAWASGYAFSVIALFDRGFDNAAILAALTLSGTIFVPWIRRNFFHSKFHRFYFVTAITLLTMIGLADENRKTDFISIKTLSSLDISDVVYVGLSLSILASVLHSYYFESRPDN